MINECFSLKCGLHIVGYVEQSVSVKTNAFLSKLMIVYVLIVVSAFIYHGYNQYVWFENNDSRILCGAKAHYLIEDAYMSLLANLAVKISLPMKIT